jgi:hypothetical protein
VTRYVNAPTPAVVLDAEGDLRSFRQDPVTDFAVAATSSPSSLNDLLSDAGTVPGNWSRGSWRTVWSAPSPGS